MIAERQWATACCEIFLILASDESGPLDPEQWRRLAARIAWAWDAADRCHAAQRLDEAAFNRLFDEEQAKIDALHAQLMAVIDRDLWPRELYFGGI